MSKIIKILECQKCGKELIRKENGICKNSNGTFTCNTEIYRVNEKYCSYCASKCLQGVYK